MKLSISKTINLQKAFFAFVFTLLTSITSTFATTYYVDNNAGNDLNNGLSTGSPWQTLIKVNSFLFSPNDSILFIRNGVWRGQLIPQSGSVLGYITYSDYGTGAKPLFLGSVNKSATSDWINEGGNIWRCSGTFSTDIGNLIFNNTTSFGIKKWSQLDLVTQGDYWYDLSSGKLKIFSTINPAFFYSDIECAQRNHIIYQQNVSYAVFNNLSLKYGAAHGFGGGNTQYLNIRACEISYIGGGDLNQDGSNIRFGNGIEFWGNAHDNTVEQCKVWEIYDTGLSNQNQGSTVQQYTIYYKNNIIYNCALASFEYWNKPASSTTANIHFENNTCVNAGYGWGTQRPDRVGVHILLSYNEANTDSIFIRNNIFYKANACLAMPSTWNTTNGYQKLKLSNNCYYQLSPTDTVAFLFFSSAYNTSSFTTYQTNTGQDIGSFINDPLFVNYSSNDFHIISTSPVINQGYPTGILNDFDTEARVSSIDIGADEFYPNTSVIVGQLINKSLSIFPNPATETLTINLTGKNSTVQVQIFNPMGMLLKEFEVPESAKINIADLPSGLYFIHIKNHPHQMLKFIKQ
ncbi:MAG: T9SS type A sorting domain-containing protein [Bacteroidota bacterium]|nr:T9SS type A sorting domain-containing protein [Bacteroidota bacterium]